MKHTITLTLAILALALTATAQQHLLNQPHVVPASATIHVGDVQEFHLPVSNTSATVTWQVILSNSRLGRIDPSNLNPNATRFTTGDMPGSARVCAQSSDYPGQLFCATLTVMP